MPDPALVTETYDKDQCIVAMRGDPYALVYSAQGKQITLRPERLPGLATTAAWHNPRTGQSTALGAVDRKIPPVFTPPSRGRSSNWVLVLDAAAQKFAPIGGGR
ncbi:putative collagen-binding domain-containing protein [Deinococcus arenicola]|uniref:Putative collagen-binding domain-containing protein n=1 Tax=Deinococcus arenicola TaxID=2994950 RepID=A0ABU4DT20_9DEIO|nr:putative collagen-binding domain-containing protein [Deinococcus sp. ZS9-10]MDV6375586.1 hypothetical protein [Deinococcus sp. ZS9-10]